jgi:hypothetical protein
VDRHPLTGTEGDIEVVGLKTGRVYQLRKRLPTGMFGTTDLSPSRKMLGWVLESRSRPDTIAVLARPGAGRLQRMRQEIFVAKLEDPAPRKVVIAEFVLSEMDTAISELAWSPDETVLYFRLGQELFSVTNLPVQ